VILDAAVAEDAGVHSKAIRLLANRLFPQPIATAQVACRSLHRVGASVMMQKPQTLDPRAICIWHTVPQ
jgi:hypothetical protein